MIQIVEHNSQLYWRSVRLRHLVLRKPLGMEFQPTQLAEEVDSTHFVKLSTQKDVIGCLILKPISADCLKMRQVAVHPNHSRKGIGTELVNYSEQYALQQHYSSIELHARESAIAFYRALSYQPVGKSFIEIGLPHQKMIKRLC